MDRGAWPATVYGVEKSRTRLSCCFFLVVMVIIDDYLFLPFFKEPFYLEKEMATHSSIGESQGQRSLVGYSPWGYKELDTTSNK